MSGAPFQTVPPAVRPPKLAGRVVIATHNPGKLAEMRQLLAPSGIETVSAGDLGLPEPVENGTMFAENAAIKALAAARAAGLPSISDDSGLCVDALDGAPGLFTADWAGRPRDFDGAMARVEAELAKRRVMTTGARAHFTAALVVAWPEGALALFEGRVFGTLRFPPAGKLGFGYDPIFVPDGFDRSFGEISADDKHGIRVVDGRRTGLSHRARAFVQLEETLL